MENIETAYQSTLDYLYSFVDYSLTRSLRYSEEKFDLGRMHKLVEWLGSPHRKFPVVHVAGTKGKGSTSAMIAGVLQDAGYKVGLYTSPHMIDFTERIQIDRVPVSHEDLVCLVDKLKPAVEQIEQLTTFELTTAAGFLYFAQKNVDIAVVEVGLGGRLDSTNVVDPLISVVTSLSMDHMNVLGDTLEKIAFEKGGIIKPGRPVIIAAQKPEAILVLKQIAEERQSPVTLVEEKYAVKQISHSLAGQEFQIYHNESPGIPSIYTLIQLPLLGQHQVQNAATAFAALETLQDLRWTVTLENIQHGFSQIAWPGRFEKLRKEPLVIIDSAHNLDSAEKLAQTVRDYLPGRPLTLLFGASEDKDVAGMFKVLAPIAERIIVTQSFHPRSFDPTQLAEIAREYFAVVDMIPKLESALDLALKQIARGDVLLITGSIFVAAGARQYLVDQDTTS